MVNNNNATDNSLAQQLAEAVNQYLVTGDRLISIAEFPRQYEPHEIAPVLREEKKGRDSIDKIIARIEAAQGEKHE